MCPDFKMFQVKVPVIFSAHQFFRHAGMDVNILLSLTLSPEGDMLLFISLMPLIATLAIPPCLIVTTRVFSKFGSLTQRFYKKTM